MRRAQTLICTVGTSLFFPNLAGLKTSDPDPLRRTLAGAYAARDWDAVAGQLAQLAADNRLCGAEINSLASLFAKDYADANANLFFCHSATDDGRAIGQVLARYYQRPGHPPVATRQIDDLQDDDPKRFRTQGLRNLAKVVCKIIRDYGAAACAINATGGYKAQIAIAVLMGQALGVPVYYKHERFDEIIAFPPMPVSLNFEVWMHLSGLLFVLERDGQGPASLLDDVPDDDEVVESLVERTEIDGVTYLDLSPTGQIFHETFRERFRVIRPKLLPPEVPRTKKQPPKLGDHNVISKHRDEIERYLVAVTEQVPQVRRCSTHYCNPSLPEQNQFRLDPHGIEGIFSNGTYTVKFSVETSAQTDSQRAAVVVALNEWLNATDR